MTESDSSTRTGENPPDGSFSDLKALYINCTLKPSPQQSHTNGLIDRSRAIMEKQGVEVEVVRAVDAYYEPPEDDRTYHPPRVDERTAVGRTYVEDDFESFGSGTRTFADVVVRYDAEDANDSTDPAEFDLEIAVRRANPP